MFFHRSFVHLVSAVAFLLVPFSAANGQADPLPSWNNTPTRAAIVAFVEKVATKGSDAYVPPADRIAVFDNDGTLWPENPVPFQAAFAFSEIKRLLPEHPEWKNDPAVAAFLKGDIKALTENHMQGLIRILALTHAGMTTGEFDQRVEDWIASEKHPRFDRPYIDCVYLPMIELLQYLRAHGFRTYIVSGGGMDFMRVWTERVYGIPPEQVIGSYGELKYELKDGRPVLTKSLETVFIDDKAGKPVGIQRFIGRRPIAAFGNSDGDQQMIQYTTIDNPLPSFGCLLHHTDADREYAYDAHPKSSGKLTVAMDEAKQRGWTIINMKNDWSRVLPQP